MNATTETRGLSVYAILSHAETEGIDRAIEKFGDPLTSIEKELLKTLTPEEIKNLNVIRDKIGDDILAANNNNNNNNRE